MGFCFVQSLITPSVAVIARSLPIQGSTLAAQKHELDENFFPKWVAFNFSAAAFTDHF